MLTYSLPNPILFHYHKAAATVPPCPNQPPTSPKSIDRTRRRRRCHRSTLTVVTQLIAIHHGFLMMIEDLLEMRGRYESIRAPCLADSLLLKHCSWEGKVFVSFYMQYMIALLFISASFYLPSRSSSRVGFSYTSDLTFRVGPHCQGSLRICTVVLGWI